MDLKGFPKYQMVKEQTKRHLCKSILTLCFPYKSQVSRCVIDILYFTLLTKEVIYLKMNVILQYVPYR